MIGQPIHYNEDVVHHMENWAATEFVDHTLHSHFKSKV
jgi:hypothetical protein